MTTMSTQDRYDDGDDLEATLDPIDEMLVAYLDGELSANERAKIEQRLIDHPNLRTRLQELQGGWELLDELPSVTLDDQFTHTTMEMVAAETMRELDRWSAKDLFRRFLRPMTIGLATLGCLAIGALFVRVSRHADLQRQLNDLPLAEHLDGYLTVEDLDWMRSLAENERWLETIDAAEAADVFGPMGLPPTNSALQRAEGMQRVEVIEQMPPIEKEHLLTDWRRFERLPEDRRETVRRVAAEIETDPNRDQLLRTIDAFAHWREALPSDLRDAIATGSGEERAAALRAGIEYTQREWLRDSGRQLSDEDADAIYEVMHSIASGWPDRLEFLREKGGSDRFLDRAEFLVSNYASEGFDDFEAALLDFVYVRLPPIRGMASNRSEDEMSTPEVIGRLSEDDFFLLKALLTNQTREILDTLAPTAEMQQETLMRWVRESVERKTGGIGSDQQTRQEKLKALSADDRQRVELSEPDELFQRLEYFHRRDQHDGRFWRPSRGRSGDRFRGPERTPNPSD
ncbi:MAG: hypothetical protein WD119_03115 [Pirellulaceae bacterium]